MWKAPKPFKRISTSNAQDLFYQGDKKWDRGELRPAFQLFLAAAKAGDKGSQLNVGYFYDKGIGTRSNRATALYWYKRAYRRGVASAAHNIGTIWRDERNPRRALSWFQRAVRLGDDDSNLEIAKHYLQIEHDPRKAIPYLKRVCQSDRVTDASAQEARKLLKSTEKQLSRADANRD